jgi:hypothetical protein
MTRPEGDAAWLEPAVQPESLVNAANRSWTPTARVLVTGLEITLVVLGIAFATAMLTTPSPEWASKNIDFTEVRSGGLDETYKYSILVDKETM